MTKLSANLHPLLKRDVAVEVRSRSADAVVRGRSPSGSLLRIFLVIWFIAGVIQSIFTDLNGEEAYYATFGQHLAWGYFDHPPGIAFFTRLGMLMFSGNLGPRFMMVVLNTATIWIGSRLLDPRHIPIYIAAVCGLALTQAGSFVIKTDVPLLFFETLFFYFFRDYLQGRQRIAIWVLPIAIAGMLLSKYHGIVVVGLVVLANPTLPKRGSFWLILLLSLALVLPHAIWLHAHDYVTIRYHLGGRQDEEFRWTNVAGYLLMQPFVFGPAIGLLLLPAALMAKTPNSFARTLKFNLIGILAFFFLASFAAHIHMHWTGIALVPLLTLAIPYLDDRPPLRTIFVTLAVATAVIFVPIRIYLAWDYLPAFIDRHIEIDHGWPRWAQDVRKLANGRSVIFFNDYGSAAQYMFYTGEMALSYNAFDYQNTQQDLWPIEESFRGKPAMIVKGTLVDGFTIAYASNGARIQYRYIDDFQGYSKVRILLTQNPPLHFLVGKPFKLPITLVNHYAQPIFFKPHTEFAPVLTYFFFKGKSQISTGSCDILGGTTLTDELTRTIDVQPPAIPGKYTFRLAICPGWLPPPANSKLYSVTVDPDH
jgi:Dolichyl-phosphate-mannose-protein mannosyltransferase